jgi:hypothetical protein
MESSKSAHDYQKQSSDLEIVDSNSSDQKMSP